MAEITAMEQTKKKNKGTSGKMKNWQRVNIQHLYAAHITQCQKTTWSTNGQKITEKTLFKEIQEANWQIKDSKHHWLFEKVLIKTLRIISYLSEWQSSKIQQINIGEEVKKGNTCVLFVRIWEWISHDEKQYGSFSKSKNRTTLWSSKSHWNVIQP